MSTPRARRAAVMAALGTLALASPAAARWNAPVAGGASLNTNPAQAASDASIASVAGVPYAAWREHDGTNNEVRVAALAPTGWLPAGAAALPSSPVNNDSIGDARSVAIADVNGVPYVAWTEFDGTNAEVRVARPAAGGQSWERVGQVANPASPINISPTANAGAVDIAGLNGVPYVVWTEADGTNVEVRVSRLRADGTGWEQVGATTRPASPLNASAGRDAVEPSITMIGTTPYVAWSETDGSTWQVRVARLNDAGSAWLAVGAAQRPASPVNNTRRTSARGPRIVNWNGRPTVVWMEDVAGGARRVHASVLSTAGSGWESLDLGAGLNADRRRPATRPSATVVAGQLWAAWAEYDGANREVRVARLTSPGGRWDRVATGASPINASATRDADPPSIAAVGEMPYVAWTEPDTRARQARVARLEPDFTQLSAAAVEERVDLAATVRTFGLPYQVGFQISGGGISRSTRPGALSGDPATTRASATALRSGVAYQWRPFVVAGAGGLIATGPAQSITTTQVARVVLGTPGARANRTWRMRVGTPSGIRVRVNLRSRLTVTVRGKGVSRRVTRGVRAGVTPIRIRPLPRAGVYRVTIRATASGGRHRVVNGRIVAVPRRR